MRLYAVLTFLAVVVMSLYTTSCKHDPFNNGIDPTDTIPNPVDTTTPPPVGIPCSPDSVYFQNQILPILVSNCTQSGCHNAQDHQEGIILTSYASMVQTVENATSNDPDDNEMLEAILETDPDKRMPEPPNAPLTAAQIALISQWLAQGGKNNGCDENFGGCDTVAVSYNAFIQPLVQARCVGCHSGSVPQGGIDLTTYTNVRTQALNGKLYNSVSRNTNWMPKGGAKLDACTQQKIKSWVDAGAPQN
ncbi:MAG: hypothetical protein IT270_16245 [Saprospiraceae bacterium]|nr:hypothetical protein [Saprospiraceae bacterium]